ncbi:MAG: RNA 2',3'-cyclic phosphodiesterase [Gemmatimonadota bacterium]
MRLFIALNLPLKEKRKIHSAAKPLREAGYPFRWLEPADFHLTLKFLGDVRNDVVPVAERVVERVAAETKDFPLSISGFGAFPTIRRPQVIWIGVEPTPALRCLKQDLEWGLANHGFERETRAFHPHITLGRADEEEGAGSFRGLDELSAGLSYKGKVPMKTVDLMRSQLARQGTQYTVIGGSPLKSSSRRKR